MNKNEASSFEKQRSPANGSRKKQEGMRVYGPKSRRVRRHRGGIKLVAGVLVLSHFCSALVQPAWALASAHTSQAQPPTI
jgi:hypothetical protein